MNAIVKILQKYLSIRSTSEVREIGGLGGLYNKTGIRKQVVTTTGIYWDNILITVYTNSFYIE